MTTKDVFPSAQYSYCKSFRSRIFSGFWPRPAWYSFLLSIDFYSWSKDANSVLFYIRYQITLSEWLKRRRQYFNYFSFPQNTIYSLIRKKVDAAANFQFLMRTFHAHFLPKRISFCLQIQGKTQTSMNFAKLCIQGKKENGLCDQS